MQQQVKIKVGALTLIDARYNTLTKSEKRVADYIRLHPDKTILSSLQTLAERCSVSDASVLRLCRSLGFSGYQDFKAAIVPELLKKGANIYEDINHSDPFEAARAKLIENLSNSLADTLAQHDEPSIKRVSTAFMESRKNFIIGLAGSAGVARVFNDCLLGLGIYSFYSSDRVEIERIVNQLGKSDVLLGISHSGETQEVVYALTKCRENKATTIALTNSPHSSIARLSDLVLLTMVPENLLGSYSCQPRIAQLALLELVTLQISKQLFGKGLPQ